MEERAAWAAEKELQATLKAFLKLSPVLLEGVPEKKSVIKLSGHGNARAFAAAVKPFLKLDPEIFTMIISMTPPTN